LDAATKESIIKIISPKKSNKKKIIGDRYKRMHSLCKFRTRLMNIYKIK